MGVIFLCGHIPSSHHTPTPLNLCPLPKPNSPHERAHALFLLLAEPNSAFTAFIDAAADAAAAAAATRKPLLLSLSPLLVADVLAKMASELLPPLALLSHPPSHFLSACVRVLGLQVAKLVDDALTRRLNDH